MTADIIIIVLLSVAILLATVILWDVWLLKKMLEKKQ